MKSTVLVRCLNHERISHGFVKECEDWIIHAWSKRASCFFDCCPWAESISYSVVSDFAELRFTEYFQHSSSLTLIASKSILRFCSHGSSLVHSQMKGGRKKEDEYRNILRWHGKKAVVFMMIVLMSRHSQVPHLIQSVPILSLAPPPLFVHSPPLFTSSFPHSNRSSNDANHFAVPRPHLMPKG